MRYFERSVFLRTLNYLRVEHDYSLRFNWVIPSVMTGIICSLIFVFADRNTSVFSNDGLISEFSQLLAILAPFFIASLAAVATFSANPAFDEKFRMSAPVKIQILDQGRWKERHLTLRQFLCLLFGYCGVVSLFLFFFALIAPMISGGLADLLGDYSGIASVLAFVLFIFLFSHMITATLLGLYYLSDKMHRD